MTLQGAWVPEDEHLDERRDDDARGAADVEQSRRRADAQEVGIPTTVRYAERLGVGSVPSVPSLALGSGEVTLLSMTAAYRRVRQRGDARRRRR